MNVRYVICVALFALAVMIQWPLWFGKGGFFRKLELQQDVAAITEDNNRLRRENGMIATEIESLESGTDAVIEQARTQLGMIRSDEVLFRFVPEGSKEARDSLKHAPGQTGERLFKPKHDHLYSPGDPRAKEKN